MLRSFLGTRHKLHGSSQSLNALEETQALEDAMYAASHVMNDDVVAAEEGLAKGNSSFHKLGTGVIMFMRAALGFEQDLMKAASDALADAENSAYEGQRHSQRHPNPQSIYPPGSEFGLCLAESQLMSAVVGVLNESLTESIKGFYKLRKAYVTLDAILEAEKKYLADINAEDAATFVKRPPDPRPSEKVAEPAIPTTVPESDSQTENNDDEDEFYDADEAHPGTTTPSEYIGHLSLNDDVDVNESKRLPSDVDEKPLFLKNRQRSASLSFTLHQGPDLDIFADNPVNAFIHSGSNLCFGLLQMLISLIPPAFSPLLRIVGFKGNRDAGIEMLWQATKFGNINGAFAGLVLLGYYNGFIGFCDILPGRGPGSYPRSRCNALLQDMRSLFPRSRLWLLEEARMLSGERQIEKALVKLKEASGSPLKQVEALQWFERSLDYMYIHDYQNCSDSFLKCITLNNWSHALYYYIAGSAQVELYRRLKTTDPEAAAEHAKKATELFTKVKKNAGKRRFMARQLPFDLFALRKIAKWEARASDWNVDLVEAVGVSPIEEMIYCWNGFKRMRPEHLQDSLDRLAWSESAENPHWVKEGLDEKAIIAVLRAATLRHLKRIDEAKKMLQEKVLCHEWLEFKGGNKDNWTCPVAHYEMAVNYWTEYEADTSDIGKLEECDLWLQKTANWESYDLDTRVGLRVKTGQDTVRKAFAAVA